MIYDAGSFRILTVNRAAIEQYGYALDEFLGMTIADLHPPDELARLMRCTAEHREVREEPSPWRHLRRDGSVIYVRIVSRAIPNSTPPARLVVAYDITVQTQMQEDLRRSQHLISAVWENSSDPMRVTDSNGTVIRVNDAYCRFARASRADLEGRSFAVIYPEREQARMESRYRERFRNGTMSALSQHRVNLRDGRRVWVELSTALLNTDHEPLLLTTFRDVTERHIAEERLRESQRALEASEGRLRTIIGNLPGMAYRCRNDEHWTMQFVSDGCYELTGYYASQIVGNHQISYSTIVHADDRQPVWNIVQSALADKRPFTVEYRIRAADGETRWVWEQGCGIWSEGGDLLYLDGLVLNITSRRALIAALEAAKQKADAANAAKTAFLANTSHEIRTPMNGILGLADLALQSDNEREMREYLGLLKNSGEALMAVLNDILDLAKMEAHRLAVERVPFSLPDCVKGCVDALLAPARSKGLSLSSQISPELPVHVLGDPTRIRQILLNLVGNAIKFTPAGYVRVIVAPAGDRVRFTVEDTGIGIDPSLHCIIFEPFQQADSSTTRKYGGTGLGLAITSELVRLMGGTIDVVSEPNQGCSFHIELPLPPVALPPAEMKPACATALPSLAILLAEDNPINQLVTSRLLEREGHRVKAVGDGLAAVEAVQRDRFDMVLMDMQMPGMDGMQATKAIRAWEQARGAHIPVIALTAHALRGDQEALLQAGMDGYVAKPMRSRELFEAIRTVLSNLVSKMPPESTSTQQANPPVA